MLTHPKQATAEFDTYLAEALWPLQPMWSFGRSYSLEPSTSKQTAVSSWWMDATLAKSAHFSSPLAIHGTQGSDACLGNC